MRFLLLEVIAALAAGSLVARDFIWLIARDRSTGDPVPDGYWSDVGTVTVAVLDPDDGEQEREFFGAGGLISVSDIPLVSNISVQNVTVVMSQVNDRFDDLHRTYDLKQAKIAIYRGLFDPVTRVLVAPAECRFSGFVDTVEVKTPAENEEGGVTLTCASHTQEMTRSNSDTRSDASQKLRDATDDFLAHAAVVGDWDMFWGRAAGKITSKKAHGGDQG